MEQVNEMKKPEITLPSGWASQYGGWSGWSNHYYSVRPALWNKDVGIKVEKKPLDTTEPEQQGADPNEDFKKSTYKDKSTDLLANIRYKDSNKNPEGLPA